MSKKKKFRGETTSATATHTEMTPENTAGEQPSENSAEAKDGSGSLDRKTEQASDTGKSDSANSPAAADKPGGDAAASSRSSSRLKLPRFGRSNKSEAKNSRYEPFTGNEELPEPQSVKGKREVSIFDKPPAGASSDTPAGLPPAPKPRDAKPGGGSSGDTVQMKAVPYDPSRPAVSRTNPSRPSRAPQTRVAPTRAKTRSSRVADLPRRQYTPRHRFGFFSFIFGFIGLIFKLILTTVLVTGLAIFISYEAVSHYVKTVEVVVPNVKGMRVLDAMKLLSDNGKKDLALIEEKAEASGLVAPGEIIDQKPAPGTTVKKGANIRVTISSGRASITVPELVRETLENAINKIKGAGLQVGDVIHVDSELVPKDSVISQSPEGGKGLDKPTKVDLMVSSGPRGNSVTMPDVTGITVGEARSRLGKAGISDILVQPPASGDAIVREQEPLVGKIVHQSQQVTLHTAATATPDVTVR
jgi:beta-lactam-binding protein with PASTA domain